jgi:hypothetical protein
VFEALVNVRRGSQAAPAAMPGKRRALGEFDDADVLAALHNNGWRIQGAAGELGISRPSMYKLIDAHPAIRRPERHRRGRTGGSLRQSGGDVERCAALLLTPLGGLAAGSAAVGAGARGADVEDGISRTSGASCRRPLPGQEDNRTSWFHRHCAWRTIP